MDAMNNIQSPSSDAKNVWFRLGRFARQNQRSLSALAFLVALMAAFIFGAPKVFLNSQIYTAVFTTLPLSLLLAVPFVFIVAAGEIDLSFPAVVGLAGWSFALIATSGVSSIVGLLVALVVGMLCGLLNGFLITKVRLSSLIATLGMNYLLRGIINIERRGYSIPLTFLNGTSFYKILVGQIGFMPVHMIWALLFAILGWFLFNRHKLGAHACSIGDNQDSATEMGISVVRTKTITYVYMGLVAAFVGVLGALINNTYYPTQGDSYLLPVLAAVFVGGTPTWGGVGTIAGAVIGSFIVGFIETGIIATGLTGYVTKFFEGLIIVLSLISHRFNQTKHRY